MTTLNLLNRIVNVFISLRKSDVFVLCATMYLMIGSPILLKAAPGNLDSAFGSNGVKTTAVGYSSSGNSVVIQPDGKIVAVGTTTNTSNFSNAFVSRYSTNGILEFTNTITLGISNVGNSVAIQPDGKIVVVGLATVSSGIGNVFIARYFSNGTLEFANTYAIGYTSGANSVAIQTDGKIVITGSSTSAPNTAQNSFIARFLSNGSLEFANTNVIGYTSAGNSLAIQQDGKIVITGSTAPAINTVQNSFIARYLSNGNLEFANTTGISFTSSGNSVAIQQDGKIVITGSTAPATNSVSKSFIARYSPSGSIEFSNVGGVGFTSIGNSIAIQPNGKLVITGSTAPAANTAPNSFVARYSDTGNLDSTFGNGGISILSQGIGNTAKSVKLQPDGKIVIAGTVTVSSGIGNSFVARYIGDFPYINFAKFDFDGDLKDDVSLFHSDSSGYGFWQILNSLNNSIVNTQFGLSTDKIVPADYDGDGKTDIAVFRQGDWFILRSSDNAFQATNFGLSNDFVVPADYDGDKKADIAVFRQGVWSILQSSNGQPRIQQFGISTDKPIVGDFDADGRSDLAVYRNGVWYVNQSFWGFTSFQFGLSTDRPVAADYDADGKTDFAVYRPSGGNWYIQKSRDGFASVQFGNSTDTVVPADYDGDKKADVAVFRDGVWFIIKSADNSVFTTQLGTTGDVPVPSAFVP